jgi:3-oxoacyl-[acyl-carrier-protein] synthase II
VPNTARRKEVRYALSNSFGFGGTNSCLLFGKFTG